MKKNKKKKGRKDCSQVLVSPLSNDTTIDLGDTTNLAQSTHGAIKRKCETRENLPAKARKANDIVTIPAFLNAPQQATDNSDVNIAFESLENNSVRENKDSINMEQDSSQTDDSSDATYDGENLPTIDNAKQSTVIISPVDKKIVLAKLNPLLLKRELRNITSGISAVKPLRFGGLVVLVNDPNAVNAILKINTLCNIQVTATTPRSGREIKGIVRDVHLDISNGDLKNEFQDNCEYVVDAKRLGEKSMTCCVTFSGNRLPEYIYLGYRRLPVKPFFERPIQCYVCQRYGHMSGQCKGKERCLHCGELGHSHKTCENKTMKEPSRCCNCQGQHHASSRYCPARQVQVEIIKYKTLNKTSYEEAKQTVLPKKRSYADALKRIQNVEEIVRENSNTTPGTSGFMTIREQEPPEPVMTIREQEPAQPVMTKCQLLSFMKMAVLLCSMQADDESALKNLSKNITMMFNLNLSPEELKELMSTKNIC